MPTSFYDVVVLGAELAPLSCGALLAKRGFRVLVLGQDEIAPHYEIDGQRLPSRPFQFVGAKSPVTQRLTAELGLGPNLRRETRTPDPSFQFALPDQRFDMFRDQVRLQAEVAREFPKVQRLVEDFHTRVCDQATLMDGLVERELMWPPETFLEKREFARAASSVADAYGQMGDPFGEYPDDHPFRAAAQAVLALGSAMHDEAPSALRVGRTYLNRYQRSQRFSGGYSALQSLLLDRIRAHSGEVRLDERAAEIEVKRNAVEGVKLFGSGDPIGAGYVICGVDLSALLPLLPDRAVFERLFERLGEPQLRTYRHTLNVVIRAEGVPEGMAEDVIHVEPVRGKAPRVSQVQRTDLDGSHCVISVETLLAARRVEEVDGYLSSCRQAVLASLRKLIPFLDDFIVMVHSPHDGLPAWSRPVHDTAPVQGHKRAPQTMPKLHSYAVTSGLDLCALPVRSPLRQLLLCNRQVVPGLDMEGELLAATSAAQVVTRSDRSREWMRRGLWTKVEI